MCIYSRQISALYIKIIAKLQVFKFFVQNIFFTKENNYSARQVTFDKRDHSLECCFDTLNKI